jgi:hypothetical protein
MASEDAPPRRARSGVKVTSVNPRLREKASTLGGSASAMLSSHTCEKRVREAGWPVRTAKRVARQFVAFAPTPLRPPARRAPVSRKFEDVRKCPNTAVGVSRAGLAPSSGMPGMPPPSSRTHTPPPSGS